MKTLIFAYLLNSPRYQRPEFTRVSNRILTIRWLVGQSENLLETLGSSLCIVFFFFFLLMQQFKWFILQPLSGVIHEGTNPSSMLDMLANLLNIMDNILQTTWNWNWNSSLKAKQLSTTNMTLLMHLRIQNQNIVFRL